MILAHNNNNNNKEAKDLIQEKKKLQKNKDFYLDKNVMCLNCLCNNLLFFIKICISNQIRK